MLSSMPPSPSLYFFVLCAPGLLPPDIVLLFDLSKQRRSPPSADQESPSTSITLGRNRNSKSKITLKSQTYLNFTGAFSFTEFRNQ